MSDGNRSRVFETVTAIFAAVIVALVLKTTWDLSASNSHYFQEAEQSAEKYADRTQERIGSTCAGMAPTALAKCADEVIKASHEAQTAQRDLAAQRGMHTWAIAMFWATAASVVVTGIGILFVWRTLNANTAAVAQASRANDIARASLELSEDTARRQLRAYVGIKRVQFEYSPRTRELNYTVEVINFGNTPAKQLKSVVWCQIEHGKSQGKMFVKDRTGGPQLVSHDESSSTGELPQQQSLPYHGPVERQELLGSILSSADGTVTTLLDRIMNGTRGKVYVAGIFIYKDVFGSTRRTTFKAWMLIGSFDDQGVGRAVLSKTGNRST